MFTASMEIYGTAVADKLDKERGILRRRYYRQHCTLDFGSYTKDLSAICADLSSVFILDNSPGAYRSYPGKIGYPAKLRDPLMRVSNWKTPQCSFIDARFVSTCRQRHSDQVVVQRPLRHGPPEPAARPGRAPLRHRRPLGALQEPSGAQLERELSRQ